MAIDLTKRTRGRPLRLTDEIWQILVDRTRKRNYISVVCQAAGIDRNTLTSYMTHAKDIDDYIVSNNILDQLPDSYKDVTDDIYILFPEALQDKLVFWYLFKDLKRAEAEGTIALSNMVYDAGPKNWLAAMTLLERTAPDMYGRRDAVDINVKEGQELLQRLATILKPDIKQLTP
jgi:hypothetical protein